MSLFLSSRKHPTLDRWLYSQFVITCVFISFLKILLRHNGSVMQIILSNLYSQLPNCSFPENAQIWKNLHISLLHWNCWALLEKMIQLHGWLAPQVLAGKVQQPFDLIRSSFLFHSPQWWFYAFTLPLFSSHHLPSLRASYNWRTIQTIKRTHIILWAPHLCVIHIPFFLSPWRDDFWHL